MIDAREVLDRAAELSLDPSVVEKDYVLGWLLAGIDHHASIGGSWVFKGGTCLKKVHFETYRFSEDLDFTLIDSDQLDEAFLKSAFAGIAAWIYEQCGVEIPADQIRFETYANKRGGRSAQGRVYYRGPLRRRSSLTRVKLDLTVDEVVVLEPTRFRIVHPYSDDPPEGIRIRCYPYTEVFAEKVRALGERCRPRDLYDVINLFRREEALQLATSIHEIHARKCAYKGITATTLAMVESHRSEIESDWKAMLGHPRGRSSPIPSVAPLKGPSFSMPNVPTEEGTAPTAPTGFAARRLRRGPSFPGSSSS